MATLMANRKSRASQNAHAPSLSQEAYLRVHNALISGAPRKKVFSDVAREMNALGYRNRKNARLRATSIERLYYEVRRKKSSDAEGVHRPAPGSGREPFE